MAQKEQRSVVQECGKLAQKAGLCVMIPGARLMKMARRFRNEDFLATLARQVQFDSATNYTATQVMQVVKSLDDTFSNIKGMEDVGKMIAATLRPLLTVPLSPRLEHNSHEVDQISALFSISPEHINLLAVSDAKIRTDMDESASQAGKKLKKDKCVNNFETMFYVLQVLAMYHPKTKTFDIYHAYVYCRDTSPLQIFASGALKKQRVAALELEGMRILGTTMAQNSNNAITMNENEEAFKEVTFDLV